MPTMFLTRMSLPATAAAKLTWSRTLTYTLPLTSQIAALATASGRTRLKKTPSFSVTRRTLCTNANEGAATDSEDSTATIPAWLDIDPEVVQEVLGEVTLKKFQFRQVVSDVAYLERVGFPLPEEKITGEQLETLISLRTLRCRNMYVHALSGADGRPDPDEVVKMDKAWLPDGYSQIFRSYVFGPSGFWTMAPPRYTAKFDPFLSLDCARVEGVGAQSKERKGSNFAV